MDSNGEKTYQSLNDPNLLIGYVGVCMNVIMMMIVMMIWLGRMGSSDYFTTFGPC